MSTGSGPVGPCNAKGHPPTCRCGFGGTGPSAEADLGSLALMERPRVVPLSEALADQHTLTLPSEEFGEGTGSEHSFDHVEVFAQPYDGTFIVKPIAEVDLADDLAGWISERKGIDHDVAHAAVTRFLAEHGDVVNTTLNEDYGVSNDDTRDWDMRQSLSCEAELPGDATTDQVMGAAESTSLGNLIADYEDGEFFRGVLCRQAVASGGSPYVDGRTRKRVIDEQIDRILDADNPTVATSMAPRLGRISKAAERDANAIRVQGRDDYRAVEGALNGRARAGDYVQYRLPHMSTGIEFEVTGMKQTEEDGSWVYVLRNTDTGDIHEENLRGSFWRRADWMGEESREQPEA